MTFPRTRSWRALIARGRSGVCLGAVIGVLLLAASTGAATAQQPAPVTVRPEATQQGDQLTVDIIAEDASGVGAFQMVLSWDQNVLSYMDVKVGPFLGSSGRQPLCPEPVTDAGALRFACVTFNPAPSATATASPEVTATPAAGTQSAAPAPTTAPGASGTGVLAQVRFKVLKGSKTRLALSRVILANPEAQAIPSASSDLTTNVDGPGGSSNAMWFVLGGVAGAILLAAIVVGLIRRGRGGASAGDVA